MNQRSNVKTETIQKHVNPSLVHVLSPDLCKKSKTNTQTEHKKGKPETCEVDYL